MKSITQFDLLPSFRVSQDMPDPQGLGYNSECQFECRYWIGRLDVLVYLAVIVPQFEQTRSILGLKKKHSFRINGLLYAANAICIV